jgi:hypothetical protein
MFMACLRSIAVAGWRVLALEAKRRRIPGCGCFKMPAIGQLVLRVTQLLGQAQSKRDRFRARSAGRRDRRGAPATAGSRWHNLGTGLGGDARSA